MHQNPNVKSFLEFLRKIISKQPDNEKQHGIAKNPVFIFFNFSTTE